MIDLFDPWELETLEKGMSSHPAFLPDSWTEELGKSYSPWGCKERSRLSDWTSLKESNLIMNYEPKGEERTELGNKQTLWRPRVLPPAFADRRRRAREE